MKIVIPMAGKGSRFQAEASRNSEYQKPKPLILIKGKPMIIWAIESLPFVNLPTRKAVTDFIVQPKDLIFISLTQQEEQYKITKLLKDIFTDAITVLHIPQITRGAVETALSAKEFMTEEELIISDSDHYFQGDALYQTIKTKESDISGIIPVFKPPDQEVKWSYTLFDKQKNVEAVGEKDPLLADKGAYANIGAYYFTKGKYFREEAEKMIAAGDMYGPSGKQEFYVAPLYQRLLNEGMKIKVAVIPEVWGLGVPKDAEYFEKNFKQL